VDRAYPSAETFRRVSSHFADYGITRIARQTGLDRLGIPVWCAYTPNAKSIVVANGKGLTDDDARTSAAMEALERAVACDPQLSSITMSQLELTRRGRPYDLLPELLAAGRDVGGIDEDLEFVEARDLISRDAVLVPRDAVSLDRTTPNPRYWKSSDGLASGNTEEEAIFHGLLERIERDATALWHVKSPAAQDASAISPDEFESKIIDELVGKIRDGGVSLRLFDVTSDIGIPTIAAYIGETHVLTTGSPRYVDVTFGCGTHPDVSKAAVRAITEAAQSRLTYISGARDDVYPETYLRPLPDGIRRLMVAPPGALSSSRTVIGPKSVVDLLAQCGLSRLYSVRLSDPELPFVVTKILAPELENPPGERKFRYGARAVAAVLSQ
jgi:YcaO-like protein with predicted kinase domain